MLVLGLMGSPRKKGNTDFLLSTFMDEAENLGAQTKIIAVDKKKIKPCKEYTVCEKTGFCPIDDDMMHDVYPLLREADVIAAATPIFFYSTTAQLKALIDRCQSLWARKYRLKLTDPGRKYRSGFLLALGATKGKNLFNGITLTAKYFFDAVGAKYQGSLTYRRIENIGDMKRHPTVVNDIKEAVQTLLKPFLGRKRLLFTCLENACRSQMASVFAQFIAGDKFEVLCGGSSPAKKINPVMVKVMEEKGIDMAFRSPKSIQEAVSGVKPDRIISMGCDENCLFIPDVKIENWGIPNPEGKSIDIMRNVRDEIEQRVLRFIGKDLPPA
ncbi:MAG TPA: flavin reductase [Desulfobacteraceae bacterium]|nr:MAG: flavin reductase [candidate division KSB1 bacterium]HDL08219.1 flavin reductase [Desulfobacteraceae bacterium]